VLAGALGAAAFGLTACAALLLSLLTKA